MTESQRPSVINIDVAPKLIMHYVPDILVILKRSDCPGRKAGWSSDLRHYAFCGCDKNHHKFTIVKASWLQDDEASWCLERCWVPRREKVEA